MNPIKNIRKLFSKEKRENLPFHEGMCPVCWGRQEYDRKIRTFYKDKQIDVNNRADSYMLIQRFLKEHINGIKLREPEVRACPSCGSV